MSKGSKIKLLSYQLKTSFLKAIYAVLNHIFT